MINICGYLMLLYQNNSFVYCIFQIFTRKVCEEEIEKVFSVRDDPTSLDPSSRSDLLRQRSDEDPEHEDRLARANAQHGKRPGRSKLYGKNLFCWKQEFLN